MATGLFNSRANIGSIIVPLVVPFLAVNLGWREAFFGTGMLGFQWLVFWLWLYARPESHPRVSREESRLIESDPVEKIESLPWRGLFLLRETWAFAIGKFLTDAVGWFYIFCLPRYLQGSFHRNLEQSRRPVVAVYLLAIGVSGGWLSSLLLRRGMPVDCADYRLHSRCASLARSVSPFSTSASISKRIGRNTMNCLTVSAATEIGRLGSNFF